MPTYYTIKIPWFAYLNSTCEICGKEISFTIKYHSLGGGVLGAQTPESAKDDAFRKMRFTRNQLKQGNFDSVGVHKCPTCGYIQSWMISNAKAESNPYTINALFFGLMLICFSFLTYQGNEELLQGGLKGSLFWITTTVLPLVTFLTIIGFGLSTYKYYRFKKGFNPNEEVLRNHSPPKIRNSPQVNFSTQDI